MIKVGIVGGTGYTGVELLRMLAQHPEVQLTAITSRKEAGMPVSEMFSSLRGRVDIAFSTPEEAKLDQCDAVFFATPHGVAMSQAKELLAANVRIVDLAADFRLKDTSIFEQWYGMPHSCPEILAQAVYGLAEINREAIKKARVVGLPGCYPTSVQLGFAPLISQKSTKGKKLIDTQYLISDSKSGVSGAGRKAEIGTLLAEASDNFKAYGVKGHRHLPEIEQGLKAIAGHDEIKLTFVPHLVPMIRGIHSTLYARILPEGLNVDYQALFLTGFKPLNSLNSLFNLTMLPIIPFSLCHANFNDLTMASFSSSSRVSSYSGVSSPSLKASDVFILRLIVRASYQIGATLLATGSTSVT